MLIATIAANVAAAQASVDTANDAASVVKFNALADFAAGVALTIRTDHINKGSNLETDGKGRIVALVDQSKKDRALLVTALEGAGVKEKDAANIGSMARTVALHFVDGMIRTGSITAAKSGDQMREFIVEGLLTATGGKDTYNAVEKARGRKWAEPAPEAEEPAPLDLSAELDDAPTSAIISDAPSSEEGEEPADAPLTAEEILNAEVRKAVWVIASALDRGDMARLLDNGFRSVATQGVEAITAYEREEARLKAEEDAQELEQQAAKKRAKAG